MTRFTTPDSLVQIPAMNAATADALATQLEQKASSFPNLPSLIRKALDRCLQLRDHIVRIASDRIDDKGTVAKEADHNLDGSWAGLFGLCRAYLRLPKTPENAPYQESAQIIIDTLYRGGLDFTQLPYPEQWSASKNRIGLIDTRGLQQHINRLSGQLFLTNLLATQDVYGRVLGITDDAVKQATINLATALTRFRQLLRQYVVKVVAHRDEEDPASQEMVDALLLPLEEWRQSLSWSSAEPADDQPTDAEPTDAEPTDAEPTDAEPTDAEPTDAEPSDAEPADADI